MRIIPSYEKLHPWEQYAQRIMAEYKTSWDEGKDLEQYESLFKAVEQMPLDERKVKMADLLFDIALNAPIRKDFPYVEPSDLKEIRNCSGGEKGKINISIDEGALRNKIFGAWMGRICGCLLGKPIEGILTDELHPLLKHSGNYPMTRYIRSTDITEEMKTGYRFFLGPKLSVSSCFIDEVDYMPYDDDTNYVVMAMSIIEKYGKDFTSSDVAQDWMELQPKIAYCTAERVAYCNFVRGIFPPESALYQNPYREGIGAQIRGDYYGYITPGDPDLAAEMAWRDASVSHVKNGIYGEMLVAAMLSIAAVDTDIKHIILGAMKEIPPKSRLYEHLEKVLNWYDTGVSEEECFRRIHEEWDERKKNFWSHIIPNAMIVVASLLYGEGDFGKSICLAVQTAFDTDCNGATVGSIAGMRCGIQGIDSAWSDPIHGMLETTIIGKSMVKIEDMVNKTMEHIKL